MLELCEQKTPELTESTPYLARKEFGYLFLASSMLSGPQIFSSCSIALSPYICMATIGPVKRITLV